MADCNYATLVTAFESQYFTGSIGHELSPPFFLYLVTDDMRLNNRWAM